MAYNAPSIVPYNYNANPPPDDGSRTASNRVSWAKVRTALSDPLRSWMDAINNEIARAFTEVQNYYVPVGAYMQLAWSGAVPGYVGLNQILSTTDYAQLAALMAGVWTYTPVSAGQMLTPPWHWYARSAGVWSVGFLAGNQNAFHTHSVTDPGHAHTLPTQWAAGSRDVAGSTLSTIPLTGFSQNAGAAVTGVTIVGDGGDEARPNTMTLLGAIKT